MIVACVRTGEKYATKYVYRLRNMVASHLDVSHRFVCLTDDADALPGIETFSVDPLLPGWWAKMELFKTKWRSGHRVVYLDLDSVIVGNITPLAKLNVHFGICANFTLIHQQRVCITGKINSPRQQWPCRYGSCCMTIAEGFGGYIWDKFNADRYQLMRRNYRLGDQKVIEEIEPSAQMLQPLLPDGFFLGYRDLPEHKSEQPPGAAIVIFAGSHKPDNTETVWVRDAWR